MGQNVLNWEEAARGKYSQMGVPPSPRMGKPVNLRFRGYYGDANYIIVLGVICASLIRRLDLWHSLAERKTNLAVEMGSCHVDNVEALEKDAVDAALTNTVTVSMATRGVGMFNKKYPDFRVLGSIAHDDRLLFAVRKDTGVTSFEDIKDKQVPLNIATNVNDGIDTVGWVVEEVFKAYGFTSKDIEKWGGKVDKLRVPGRVYRPAPAVAMMMQGDANAIFHEAVMGWGEMFDKYDMRILPIRQDIMDKLSREQGFIVEPMPASVKRLRGVDKEFPCISWADWTLATKAKFDEELAYQITKIMVEDAKIIERRLRPGKAYEPDIGGISPQNVFRVKSAWNFPLHPGAERYYTEKGLLK
jgi:TRAP transporter TAXI family solute receptor